MSEAPSGSRAAVGAVVRLRLLLWLRCSYPAWPRRSSRSSIAVSTHTERAVSPRALSIAAALGSLTRTGMTTRLPSGVRSRVTQSVYAYTGMHGEYHRKLHLRFPGLRPGGQHRRGGRTAPWRPSPSSFGEDN